MATQPSILAWEIPWTEEPGRLWSMGLPRVRHDLATKQPQQRLNKTRGKKKESGGILQVTSLVENSQRRKTWLWVPRASDFSMYPKRC